MKATLLPSIADQIAAGDDTIIDPRGVRVRGAQVLPVFLNFSYDVRDIVGWAGGLRVEQDALVADIELAAGRADTGAYSIAGVSRGGEVRHRNGVFTHHEMELMSVHQVAPKEPA